MPRILLPTSLHFEGVINFFFWEITETVEGLLALFTYPDYMRKEIEDFSRNITRQKEWLATRLLLKEALGNDVKISHTVSGRPFLVGSTDYVSISHTRQYVVLALARGHSELILKSGVPVPYDYSRSSCHPMKYPCFIL